jgi:TPR repeat protein
MSLLEAHRHRHGMNFQEAVHLYKLAAEQGDADGESWLAYCYLMRWGGIHNDAEAFRLSELGVKKEDPLHLVILDFVMNWAGV